MTIENIITADEATLRGGTDSVLRTEFTPVTEFDERLQGIVADLRDTLHSDTLSVGLAAPQIGVPDAVAIINIKKEQGQDLVLVNPIIVSESGSWDSKYESCMSIPHKRGEVKRRKKVTIEYHDVHGARHELSAESFLARVIMHEVDHLHGVLFVDRMSENSDLEDTELFREHGVD